jgi:hypothetical protein
MKVPPAASIGTLLVDSASISSRSSISSPPAPDTRPLSTCGDHCAPPDEKKKRLRYTPISVRFGATEAASDFGSVCLAEAKSEVHTEAHVYESMTFRFLIKVFNLSPGI